MNSTAYYLNKQLVQYVTSCLEMRDNLLSKAWYCNLIYFLLVIFKMLLQCCKPVSFMAMQVNLIVVVVVENNAAVLKRVR